MLPLYFCIFHTLCFFLPDFAVLDKIRTSLIVFYILWCDTTFYVPCTKLVVDFIMQMFVNMIYYLPKCFQKFEINSLDEYRK